PAANVRPVAPAGRRAGITFFDRHAAEMRVADFPRALKGPWKELEALCARLALILAGLRWAFPSQVSPGSKLSPMSGDTKNPANTGRQAELSPVACRLEVDECYVG